LGKQPKDKPLAQVRTGSNGLNEIHLRPKAKQFRQGGYWQQTVEMAGGQKMTTMLPHMLLDMAIVAKDKKGTVAQSTAELTSEPFGDNVLLRLDKAIYQGGEPLKVSVRSSAGLPTAYLDIVRSGQTLLTKWLNIKNGAASETVQLPAEAFGTLEVHAYQMLANGEMIRDSRVIYVQPADDLKIKVEADQKVYQPGATGKIAFTVTDASGKPTTAALGVLIVDEAVYAFQEMQPGLEKVYFTLQQELLKPQAQAILQPGAQLPPLIRRPVLAAPQQEVAQALFSAVRPPLPARWDVAPGMERQQRVTGQISQLTWSVFSYANSGHAYMHYDRAAKKWVFNDNLLDDMLRDHFLAPQSRNDPFDRPWTIAKVQKLDKHFTADDLAKGLTINHMQSLEWPIVNYANQHQAEWLKNGEWTFPKTIVQDAANQQRWAQNFTKDAWGHFIRLVKREKKWQHPGGWTQFRKYELVSAGPDGKFGTADDIKQSQTNLYAPNNLGWGRNAGRRIFMFDRGIRFQMLGRAPMDGVARFGAAMPAPAGMGGAGFGGGMMGGAPAPMAVKAMNGAVRPLAERQERAGTDVSKSGAAGPAPPRVREFFPETMLWQPLLVTDEHGHAELAVGFADSITTWRLTASASSQGGLLGGVSAPLRVFQDFFVDLDLPVSLTQHDEVAFPVAVYNYLSEK
ncbi:MAG TPA: alpha-2-macroglobulin family protein, partial [Gemmataceae bacterium]|nr:alpha-2-macroglobulin family protein [Gemmataceae bacterium]